MGLFAGLAELMAPTRCSGCELPGDLLCAECLATLTRFDARESCPRCAAPYGALVCTECWQQTMSFEAAVAVGELAAPLARAVVLHKDGGERRLGERLGSLVSAATTEAFGDWPDAVTWIPATRAALRRRGFDHARALAEPVSQAHGVPLRPLLGRAAALDQRALGRR